MRRFLLLTLLFASPALADRRTEEIAVIAASAADFIATEVWLHDDTASVTPIERNPLAQSTAARIAVKAGSTAGLLWLARFAERKGHDRMASIVRLTGISVWSGAAGFNISLTIRH